MATVTRRPYPPSILSTIPIVDSKPSKKAVPEAVKMAKHATKVLAGECDDASVYAAIAAKKKPRAKPAKKAVKKVKGRAKK